MEAFIIKLLISFVNIFLLLRPEVYCSDVSVKAVSAIYNVEIENISCYEATIPIFFHVELPHLPERFPQVKSVNCSADSNGTISTYCTLDSQFTKALNHIMADLHMQRLQFTKDSEIFHEGWSREKRQAAPVIAATSIIAGFLLRPAISKFTGKLFGSDEEWMDHFNALRDSLVKEHDLLIDFEGSVNHYTHKMEKFLANISEMLAEQKLETIWSLRLLLAKIHTDVIDDAIQACRTKHIPGNLIHNKLLEEKLSELKNELEKKNVNYTLAIDVNETGKYYKLPIVDCLFTPTKAHIIMNIPLKSKHAHWKLYEIIHTKYAFHNQVCELYPQEAAYLAVSQSSKDEVNEKRTVLITNHMLKHCSVFEHRLCMIPQFSKDSVQSLRCSAAMLENDDPQELLKSCSFRCYTNDELIITQITDTKIVVTNAVNLTYQCVDKSLETHRFEKLGALEININCECDVIINDQVKLPKPFPCIQSSLNGSLSLNITVPILWMHNLSDPESCNGQQIILHQHVNYDWPWLVPVLNFTHQQAKVANFTIPEKAVYSSVLSTELWLGLLTVALVLHVCLTMYCFFKVLLARYGLYDLSDSHEDKDVVDWHARRRHQIHRRSLAEQDYASYRDKTKEGAQFSNRLV